MKTNLQNTVMRFCIGLFSLIALAPSRRHVPTSSNFLWLEADPARVFFGEYENALREKSPGRLDSITGLALRVGYSR